MYITHVINVSATGDRATFLEENDHEHFLRIPINDCLNAQLLPYLEKTYAFIGNDQIFDGIKLKSIDCFVCSRKSSIG